MAILSEPKKRQCMECNEYFLEENMLGMYCQACFTKEREKKSIYERIADIEIQLAMHRNHHPVSINDMRF